MADRGVPYELEVHYEQKLRNHEVEAERIAGCSGVLV